MTSHPKTATPARWCRIAIRLCPSPVAIPTVQKQTTPSRDGKSFFFDSLKSHEIKNEREFVFPWKKEELIQPRDNILNFFSHNNLNKKTASLHGFFFISHVSHQKQLETITKHGYCFLPIQNTSEIQHWKSWDNNDHIFCIYFPSPVASMYGIFTYMKTLKINHPCRQIYQPHGLYGSYLTWLKTFGDILPEVMDIFILGWDQPQTSLSNRGVTRRLVVFFNSWSPCHGNTCPAAQGDHAARWRIRAWQKWSDQWVK